MFHTRTFHDASRASQFTANEARGEARSAKHDAQFLQHEVDRLSLVCEGLWNLLKQKMDVSDQELMAEVEKVDLIDGKLDGKAKKGPLECSSCSKMNARRHTSCIYCGMGLHDNPFD